jgi:hypothetical protein
MLSADAAASSVIAALPAACCASYSSGQQLLIATRGGGVQCARRAAVGRASPEARTDAELPRTRPIAIAPPLATVAGEVSKSLLLVSHWSTGCGGRLARKTLLRVEMLLI